MKQAVLIAMGILTLMLTGMGQVNAREGTLKWRFEFETGQYNPGSPAIGPDGTVYVASYDGCLYGVNPDGTLKWELKILQYNKNVVSVDSNGVIYTVPYETIFNPLSAHAHSIMAVNPDGTLKWRFETPNYLSSLAIGSDGTLYVKGNSDLYAVNPDGTEKWRNFNYMWGLLAPTVGLDDVIYFEGGSGNVDLYAVRPDGTLKSAFPLENSPPSSLAMGTNGTIYFSTIGIEGNYTDPQGRETVHAVKTDGTKIWSFQTEAYPLPQLTIAWGSAPAIGSGGTIYVGSHDTHLYALNPDGTEKWRFKTGDAVISSPAVGSNGTIYFGSKDAYFYAVNPDGTKRWRYQAGGAIHSSPAVGSDGTLYISDTANTLYAVTSSSSGPADSSWPMFGQNSQRTYNAAGTATVEVELLSPPDNDTLGYDAFGGKVTFSFTKAAYASKYILHINLYDPLTNSALQVPVELLCPAVASNPFITVTIPVTPGFDEQNGNMVYELTLDAWVWKALAAMDITWGVEAYDENGNLIASTPEKYLNTLKFL